MDITTVTSSAEGLVSNTHLVSAPDGIIVIDPPMLLSDARAVRARLDQLGRPLAAFVYTHPRLGPPVAGENSLLVAVHPHHRGRDDGMLRKARLLGDAVRDGAIEERHSESVGNPRPDDASARP